MKERTLIGGFILLCILFLAGCTALADEDGNFDGDALNKAQRIEVTDPQTGELIRTLETEAEIDAFVDALTMDSWHFDEPPEDAVWDGAFTLYQQETIRPGNQEPEMIELCTLYSYEDAAYLAISTPLADIPFAIPQGAADYLHSLTD